MNILKKVIFSFSAFILLASPIQVMAYPEAQNYANDFANVLDSEVENEINQKNRELEESNGAQIFVVTVDFLDGEAIDDYAYHLFNEWQIGSATENNGVLLLLAIGEDNYYCLQGSGLESSLSSGTLQTILDTYLEPDFASKNYSDGVSKTFNEIYEIVKNTSGTPVYVDPNNDHPTENHSSIFDGFFGMIGTIISFVILIIVISAIFSRPSYRRPFFGYGRPYVHHHHHYHSSPRPPRSSNGGRSSSFGGGASRGGSFRSGGGGSSRGGGAGRH